MHLSVPLIYEIILHQELSWLFKPLLFSNFKLANTSIYLFQEIDSSVKAFAASLQTTDQCAVLVILSHGKEGFVFGSDGNKIFISQILEHLNNVNCPKMEGKPKIIIIQACQGGKY